MKKPHYSLHSLNLLSFKTFSTSPSFSSVALFWDLNSKPTTSSYRHLSLSLYDVAVRFRLAAASFGHLLSPSLAFASFHLPSRSPPLQPPFPCRLCGRTFPSSQILIHHFTSVHSPEHERRLRRLESATGRRWSILSGQLSLNPSRYEKAHRELFGRCENSTGEVRRAGFKILEGGDKIMHLCDELANRRVDCAVIVSDDLEFVTVLKEMRQKNVKSVVIGESKGDNYGIKRHANVGFCWREVLAGKVKQEGPKVVSQWREKELLERLEWRHDPSQDDVDEGLTWGTGEEKAKHKPWWKLDNNNVSNQEYP
ncbi:C2H2 type zinc finger protein [Rhynchospora pubera]|uniref:C2H2 type zinc finger protein n=1 Tax=Rhynchospora pubera TaxID=906938 RepID=A0AAV8G7C1_9POAL|nr:C2H2 type zinc finger protein [Rhynchospora pubera]